MSWTQGGEFVPVRLQRVEIFKERKGSGPKGILECQHESCTMWRGMADFDTTFDERS
jgi:hypothetical protein